MNIQLTPEELAIFKPFADDLDRMVAEYAAPFEASKRKLLQVLLSLRPKSEADATTEI